MTKENNMFKITEVIKSEVPTAITVCDDDINNIVPYVPDEDRITKKGCKLCQSEFRDEAEAMFMEQRTPNYNSIYKALKGKGFKGTWQSVKNHLVRHYKNPKNRDFLIDYAEDLQKWLRMQPNKVQSLKKRIAILEREMFLLASEADDMKPDERRKNAETVKKLADTILNYEAKLDVYQKSLEPATVVINQLKLIITDEVKHVSSRETKQVLVKVLERMQDQVGDLVIEENE